MHSLKDFIHYMQIGMSYYHCLAKAVYSLARIRFANCLSVILCVSCPPSHIYMYVSSELSTCVWFRSILQFCPLIFKFLLFFAICAVPVVIYCMFNSRRFCCCCFSPKVRTGGSGYICIYIPTSDFAIPLCETQLSAEDRSFIIRTWEINSAQFTQLR